MAIIEKKAVNFSIIKVRHIIGFKVTAVPIRTVRMSIGKLSKKKGSRKMAG